MSDLFQKHYCAIIFLEKHLLNLIKISEWRWKRENAEKLKIYIVKNVKN